MNYNRLVIKQTLHQMHFIVEGLIEKAVDTDMYPELIHLQRLILKLLEQIDISDFDKDQIEAKFTDIVDWLLRIYAVKEIVGL